MLVLASDVLIVGSAYEAFGFGPGQLMLMDSELCSYCGGVHACLAVSLVYRQHGAESHSAPQMCAIIALR